MIVVADTAPLNYLVLMDEVNLLPALFGMVFLPRAVFQELQHAKTPERVRVWAANLPEWAEVRVVASVASPELMTLDIGEREAMQLALELGLSTVLIDEVDGRRQAPPRRSAREPSTFPLARPME